MGLLGSLLWAHINTNVISATIATTIAWVLAMVFYRIGKLKSFKADLDDKSLEIDGADEPKEKEEDNVPN